MQFTAIDFETANKRPDSACQLAAVVVRDRQIVDQRCWLIRPRPFYFSRFNIKIHGIEPTAVEDEPEFGALWHDIGAFLGEDCLVAHNAIFDIKVLGACLQAHRLPVPSKRFTCTRLIARQTWPQWRRYGLKPCAQRLGIEFRHHDALEDAATCAKVLIAAGIQHQSDSLERLEQRLRLDRGQLDGSGFWGPRRQASGTRRQATPAGGGGLAAARSRRSAAPTEASRVAETTPALSTIDIHRLTVRAQMLRFLHGRQVVLQGKFRWMSTEEATRLVIALGAAVGSTVTSGPEALLVVGNEAGDDLPKTSDCMTEQQLIERLTTSSPGTG